VVTLVALLQNLVSEANCTKQVPGIAIVSLLLTARKLLVLCN